MRNRTPALGRALAGALLCAAVARPAHAVDGVTEINQAKALAGGINGDLLADPPGFPVRITSPGSYRLTSNLDLSGAPNPPNTDAIAVEASEVTLDLGGYRIAGTTACSGGGAAGVVCAPLGTGVGVRTGAVYPHAVVSNGNVFGMGGGGVALAALARVERVNVTQSGGPGLAVSSQSEVVGCHAFLNAGDGISAGSKVEIRGNRVERNGSDGIRALDEALVAANTVSENLLVGIECRASCVIDANAVDLNDTGIMASSGVVRGNAVRANRGSGISSSGSVVALENHLTANACSGLSLSNNSGYGENVLVSNNTSGLCSEITDVAGSRDIACNLVNGALWFAPCP
jgi:hypothetical protein